MKNKLTVLVSVLFAGLILVACGNSDNSTQGNSQDKLEQIKEAGELKVGTSPDYPPYEFYILDDNGNRQIVGSDIDLANAIAEEIGVNLNIIATDFTGVIANVQSASVDIGLAGFTYTETREEVMQFSEGYTQESVLGFQGLLMSQEDAENYQTLEDIKSKELTIGAQSGSIQFELAQSLTDSKNVKQYGTLDVGLAALNEGDIDAMVVATSSAEPMLVTFPRLTILPEEKFNLDPEEKYKQVMAGFPKGEEYKSLIELANKVINEAIENGNIEKWQAEAKELSLKALE